jgi:hypothetical protein
MRHQKLKEYSEPKEYTEPTDNLAQFADPRLRHTDLD